MAHSRMLYFHDAKFVMIRLEAKWLLHEIFRLNLLHAYHLPSAELDDDFMELCALSQGFHPWSYGIVVDLVHGFIPLFLSLFFGVIRLGEIFHFQYIAVVGLVMCHVG